MPQRLVISAEGSAAVDRRTMLARAAAGSAALVGGLLGVSSELAAQAQAAQAPAPARVRRIVTAHNAEGKSYIVSDEMVSPANLWSTSAEQVLGAAPAGEPKQVSKVTGESRHFIAAIQPSKDPKPDLKNRLGFHRTPGVAYCYILTGELFFLVDTQEVKIKAGDLVVERNTMHSWRNEGTVPATMLITTINAAP
jgi:hypothetical protein